MKTLSTLTLALLLLLTSRAGSAQTVSTSKYEVYSAFLANNIAGFDSLSHRKSASVVVIPSGGYSHYTEMKHGFLADLGQRSAAFNTKFQLPVPSPSGKAVLGSSPAQLSLRDSNAVASRRSLNQFYQWLSTDSSRARMTRQLDSFAQTHNSLAEPIELPGKTVFVELGDFFHSSKWRSWESFYRRYKGCYGVVEFSDVAFTPDAHFAAFYVGEHQGYLNGIGYLVFMERTTRGWRVKYWSMLWIS